MQRFLPVLVLCLLAGCTAPDTRSVFQKTVILISTDGTRPDYADRIESPNIDRLKAEGVFAPEGMIPVFPTKTFPNHYSIVTGRYVGGHGIVGNSMYDPEMDDTFSIRDREAIEDPRWWTGEPIWTTAEKQGVRAATYYWVGSETPNDGVRPSYWFTYDGSVPNEERVDTVLEWLDLPDGERPGFISLYVSNVDDAGHRHGPESVEVDEAMKEVDSLFGRLMDGLEARGLYDQVNIMWVSDHGMSQLSRDRAVLLDDYIDLNDVYIVESGPNLAINVKDGKLDAVYNALKDAHPEMQIWKKEDLPERLHMTDNNRITDLVGYVSDGWLALPQRERFEADTRPMGGTHGYDNQEESMRAVFLSHGPAFKDGVTVEPFENIQLYNVMTDILGITPVANDGDPNALRSIRTGE